MVIPATIRNQNAVNTYTQIFLTDFVNLQLPLGEFTLETQIYGS